MDIKTQLYSVDTLHVAVPASISDEEVIEAFEDFSNTKGYTDWNADGYLIEAADLGNIVPDSPVMAEFINAVLERVQDADEVYLYRA